MKVFSENTHNLLRKAAIICGALAFALGIFTASVDIGRVGVVISAVIAAVGGGISYICDHDSVKYFDTRDVVTKLQPENEED